MNTYETYPYQIAPMMGWTNRHFRYLMRLMGGDSFLMFSEMLTAQALVYGDHDRYLSKSEEEGDVVLQLGGSDPGLMAEAIGLSESYGYSGYNLNVGCPSDRVQRGRIGACLMEDGPLVRDLLKVMIDSTDKPVSIKTRVGIDGVDSYDYLKRFVDEVLESGCTRWIIHARDAWLNGLNPKENRSIPPLRYEYVYRLKREYPDLHISLNGGLVSQDEIQESLKYVDSVMIGRAAYQQPRLIHTLGNTHQGYMSVLREYIKYIRSHIGAHQTACLVKPLIMCVNQYPGSRIHRQRLSESQTEDSMVLLLDQLMSLMDSKSS